MQTRVVVPEILDQLSPDDPGAIGNRRDLRILNALMGNFRWLARQVKMYAQPGQTWVEYGSGDGGLGQKLTEIYSATEWTLHGVDPWPKPDGWPEQWPWHRQQAQTFALPSPCHGVVVNLLLHQLHDAELSALGRRWQHDDGPQVLLLNETHRSRWARLLARTSFALGLNHVSRHDALVSVRAGFRRGELPHLLGLSAVNWSWRETVSPLGAYRCVAERKKGGSP